MGSRGRFCDQSQSVLCYSGSVPKAHLERNELSFEISYDRRVQRWLPFLGLPNEHFQVSSRSSSAVLPGLAHFVCFNFRTNFCVSKVRDFLSALCSSLTAWNWGVEGQSRS